MEDDNPWLWEILVPAHDNDGNHFDVEHHRVWDEYVLSISGGITIMRSAKGWWISPRNERFHDQMIPVRIMCSEEEIDKIIGYTMTYYQQEAVMAYCVSTLVKIYHKNSVKEV